MSENSPNAPVSAPNTHLFCEKWDWVVWDADNRGLVNWEVSVYIHGMDV